MNSTQLTPETMTAMREIALFIAAIVGMWVVSDARSRGKDAMAAIFWGIGAMMIMIVVLPMWFLLRPKTDISSTRSTPQTPPPSPAPSPFTTRETVGTPIPENGDQNRSKICDRCGKFYLGKFDKCPHCNAAIEN